MPTDDERREVARRLRKGTGKGIPLILNVAFSAFEFTGCSERTLNADEAALKLADLIEPSCDRDALLALADDLDYAGANVENVACIDQTFHDAARRIREALGVEQ